MCGGQCPPKISDVENHNPVRVTHSLATAHDTIREEGEGSRKPSRYTSFRGEPIDYIVVRRDSISITLNTAYDAT